MKSSETGIRKVPIICVWIKQISRKSMGASVLLTDFTQEIKGTIMNSLVKCKDYWSCLMVGSVLILKDVSYI